MAICLVPIAWVNELYYLSSYKRDIINDAILTLPTILKPLNLSLFA